MTELRKRMIESLQLRGYSNRTQQCYVRAVCQLAQHFNKSPDLITDEELRHYFLYLKNVKHYSRAASTIAICGIKFFYEQTLNKQFTTLELVRAPREKKLPVILSKESATDRVRTCTLAAEEFIRRFLQHVLPERFVKLRYYGLMSPRNRRLLEQARSQLSGSRIEGPQIEKETCVKEPTDSLRCPECGNRMRLIERLKPNGREPP